ncbi:interleukin-17C [Sorex araneus]|uniref:interleukin-17C n=1 Tax=Sorex araneus TaxID=42254 RepID=UPI00033176D5|nr:interleukin-17C [Sorex araneus]
MVPWPVACSPLSRRNPGPALLVALSEPPSVAPGIKGTSLPGQQVHPDSCGHPSSCAASPTMLLTCLWLLPWLPICLARPGSPQLRGTPRCYTAEELPLGHVPPHLLARAARWEQALPVALVTSLEEVARNRRHETAASPQCPVLRTEATLEDGVHQRSISPWRYRVDSDESRHPQKLAWAECLCRGCLSTRSGRETPALNSVPLLQTLPVLRRRPCAPHPAAAPLPGAVAFHTEFIQVPVGCTCVVPRSAP